MIQPPEFVEIGEIIEKKEPERSHQSEETQVQDEEFLDGMENSPESYSIGHGG
jgi:hypothetical protein